MKIKQDFVTNSSSTSFIFIFKGDQRSHLFEKMVKYKDKFELYNEYGPGDKKVEVWEIIHKIDPILSSNPSEPWYLPGPLKITDLLEKMKDELKTYEDSLIEELKREKEDSSIYKTSDWSKEYIIDYKEKIKKIEKALKDDLDHYIEISFGDNDGMISGGRIGMTMDYSGRSIDINQKDFMVYVTNCH